MNCEILGVTRIKELIAKSDYLVPNINENDREPSWDGDIEVYRKPGDTHRKDDLIIRVPIQVKGSCQSKHPNTIPFSVDVSDLENYLVAGGTIFFVVYVDKDGERKSAYYCELLPYTLKKICTEATGQATKTIHLKKFPTHKKDISNRLLNFAEDMKKQFAAISAESVSLNELMKDGKPKELSFSYTDIEPNKADPFEYLFNNRIYLYATFDHGVKLPVGEIKGVTMTSQLYYSPVVVGNQLVYDRYTLLRSKERTTCRIGAGITLSTSEKGGKTNVSLTPAGGLSERIRDLEFMINAISNNGFWINGAFVDLSTVSQEQKMAVNGVERLELLSTLKKIKRLLEILHVQSELDFTKLDKKSQRDLRMLMDSVIDNKEVSLIDIGSSIGIVTVANLKILVCAIKQESGLFMIQNFYTKTLIAKLTMVDGEEVDVPIGITLKREALQKIDNVDFDEIINELNGFEKTPGMLGFTVAFLLEIIHAYDLQSEESKRKNLRNGATKIIDWLKENDKNTPMEVHLLNELQLAKRERDLTDIEMNRLHEIIEETEHEDIKVGAYLLLNDQLSAKRHFDKMEPELKESFACYPICHFWKSKEESLNG